MKKVFTDNLNKTWKGIDWKKSIKEKLKIKFIYDDIEGEFEILDYNNPKKGYVKLLYNDTEYYIHNSNLSKNRIGNIIGKINRENKYNIGQIIKDNKRNITIIDYKYNNGKRMYKYKCNRCGFECGTNYSIRDKIYKDEFWILEGNLDGGKGCSCCCNPSKVVVENINSIYKTDSWMIPYIGEECSKTHTHCSHDKVGVTCPDCGKVKDKSIDTIFLLKSIACSCSDGNSYISKHMFDFLNQLKEHKQIEEFNSEIKYKWCSFYNPFKSKNTYGVYDFVLEHMNLIIETDGEFHRKDNTMSGQTKEESVWLDNTKDRLANEQGYEVIRISDNGDIKQNILNSNLNKLFDLSSIDWNKAEESASNNLVKIACEYKKNNTDLTTTEIGKIMGYCQSSIIKWLKKGK